MTNVLRGLAKTFYAVLFDSEAFQCRFVLGRGLEISVFDRPGQWMTDVELKKIHDDMIQVTRAGQKGKEVPEYGALSGSRLDMCHRVISIAYDTYSGRPVGYSAQSYLDVQTGLRHSNVLHLGLIFVDPEFQGRNLTASLSVLPNIVIFLKSGLRPVWVSNVSQVPAIIGLVGDNFADVYPVPNLQVRQSFEHRWYASQLMQRHRHVFGVGPEAEFDLDRQIIKNAYTGGSDHLKKTFQEAPKYRKAAYNEMCEASLDYRRGDDFIQLGKMDMRCYLSFFNKKVAKSFRAGALVNLAVMGLAGLIVPTIRWLVPKPVMANAYREEISWN